MDLAVIGLFIFMLIYLVICEIFTVLFRLTGVNENIARFQVISMLTSTGYTTFESELIVKHKRRRSLAFVTILFGYIFSATIISMVMNLIGSVFRKSSILDLILQGSIAICLIIVIWLAFLRTKMVKRFFERGISQFAMKYIFNREVNPILIQAVLDKEELVVEVQITTILEKFQNTKLKDMRKEHHLVILNGPEDREGTIHIGDTLIVFGTMDNLKATFVPREDNAKIQA